MGRVKKCLLAFLSVVILISAAAAPASATAVDAANYAATQFGKWITFQDTDTGALYWKNLMSTYLDDGSSDYDAAYSNYVSSNGLQSASSDGAVTISLRGTWWYETNNSTYVTVSSGVSSSLCANFLNTDAAVDFYNGLCECDFTVSSSFVGSLCLPVVNETVGGNLKLMPNANAQYFTLMASTDGGTTYTPMFNADTLSGPYTSTSYLFSPDTLYRLRFLTTAFYCDGSLMVISDGDPALIGNYVDSSASIPSSSRVGNISGTYGYYGDDGNLVVGSDIQIMDEDNDTLYNPVTGDTYSLTDWTYDYSDKSYTCTTDSGNTVNVTYGDDAVTIEDGGTYNVYYYTQSSNLDSGSSGGSSIWDTLAGAIASLFSAFGTVLGGIITGLVNLATQCVTALGSLGGLFAQATASAVSIGGGFLDLLTALFPFIMTDELRTVITLGATLTIGAVVIGRFLL